MKLSVLMAAYNEELWIRQSVSRVLAQNIAGIHEMEIIIVDDGSKDRTREIIQQLAMEHSGRIKPFFQKINQGKGAAIQKAIEEMTGDICIIQDADLEYDPADYCQVLEPIIQGRADCVYGSRFVGSQSKRVLFYWHCIGNKVITLLSNMCSNLNFTDIETCYKAFRAEVIKSIKIRSKDFGLEPEITAKLAKGKWRVFEVGISYSGRTYQEGKKINWVDGFKAIFAILRFSFLRD